MTGQPVPVSARPRCGIRRVWVRSFSDALTVDVARIVGWRATCSCGFRSRTYRDRADAAAHARDHRDVHG